MLNPVRNSAVVNLEQEENVRKHHRHGLADRVMFKHVIGLLSREKIENLRVFLIKQDQLCTLIRSTRD